MKKTVLSAVFVISSMILSSSAYAACPNASANTCSNNSFIKNICVHAVNSSTCNLPENIKSCLSGNCTTFSSGNCIYEILSGSGNENITSLFNKYINNTENNTENESNDNECTDCDDNSENTATDNTKNNNDSASNDSKDSTVTNDNSADTNSDSNSNSNTETTTPADNTNDSATESLSDYESEVLSLINSERAKNGLSALSIDSNVQKAAAVRANEITESFSHTRPNGTTCFTALAENGATYTKAGENIAYGQRSAQEVVNAWMNSEGHRKNILTPDFTKTGIGCVSVNGTLYWTQFFTK